MKSALYVLALAMVPVSDVSAEDWARKMFAETSHDFGTLARGSKAEYQFPVKNVFKEDVHIAEVRSSCGCSTATITKPNLKTWETGAVLIKFNTRSFLGQRDATITVTLDKPYFAELQLTVSGYVRSDVVFSPGSVEFGDVSLGTSKETTVDINYAGRDDWKITDVRSASDHFEATMKETHRGGGRVGYRLVLRLKDNAPAGYMNEQLILLTNDRRHTHIPFLVSGRVLSPVTVSPAALAMGVVTPGGHVTKQLVVRAKKPFRITSVRCDSSAFAFKTTEKSSRLHLIPVTFTADQPGGTVTRQIFIETDLIPNSPVTCMVTATVKSDGHKS